MMKTDKVRGVAARIALAMAMALGAGSGCLWDDSDPESEPDDDGGNDDGGGDGPVDPPRSLTICEEELTEAEFLRFLDGNLVIVAAFTEQGSSKAKAIADLVVMLVLNGIDFGQLGSARPSYQDGRYGLKTGDSDAGFRLYFAQDFESWSAGEPIPHNVFSPDSYARNIEVEVDTGQWPPTATVTWDPGPLAGLVDGSIAIDETSLAVKVRLRTDVIAIQVDSGSAYESVWEPDDELWLQMTTTQVALPDMLGDLEDAGFGFSYDDTTYDAPSLGLAQEFHDSEFLTLRLDNGNYAWEGSYRASVTKGPVTMYQSGFASNSSDDYTDYFCDPELSRRVGRAEHDRSLLFGMFVFDDGERFPYGLR
jgi:hypothetical protein